MNVRERRRQLRLAEARSPLSKTQFTSTLVDAGVDEGAAQFVWDEFQTYYFAPLTPYPADRPISEFRIDPDDLSDMAMKFEKDFGRRWRGKWIGPDDPTLIEFGLGLVASTNEK